MPESNDNDSTITESMNNADIAELTNLNDYVDKIRFEHRQNLIPTRELKSRSTLNFFCPTMICLEKSKLSQNPFVLAPPSYVIPFFQYYILLPRYFQLSTAIIFNQPSAI